MPLTRLSHRTGHPSSVAEIQLFGWGARAINFPSQEKCFCLTYFARRPDVNRVLKCAKRKDLYSAKVDRNRQKHTIRLSRIALRNLGAKPPGKFLRIRPLLLPRMHLTTKFLPVMNLDFDNFVTIFCRVGAPRSSLRFSESEKCFCLTYFAGRPDVNRVLKCAMRKDLYSAKVDRNRQKHTIRMRRTAFRNLEAKPPGKFLRTRPQLLPRMHLTTKFLPVLNLDFDNSVAIFCRVAAPRNSLSLSKHNLLWLRRLLGSLICH